MKRRMLAHLGPAAKATVIPLFDAMRADLREGLSGLQSAIASILHQVSQQASERGNTMVGNSAIDAGQTIDPAAAEVLASDPFAA